MAKKDLTYFLKKDVNLIFLSIFAT